MCFNFLHLLMHLCVRNKLQFDGLFFLDIDECAAGTHNCSTNTFCTNNEGSYNCTCNPGYYGDVENCEPGKSGLLRGRHEEPAILIYRLLLRMRRMHVACEAWNEWNAQNPILSRTFGPSTTRNLITGVLTFF